MKIYKLFNYKGMDHCLIQNHPATGKIVVVLYKDFTFKAAAEITMESAENRRPIDIIPYINSDEIRVYNGAILDKTYDPKLDTAAWVIVGRGTTAKRYIIVGLPGTTTRYFETADTFKDWYRCIPFNNIVIELDNPYAR